MTKEQRVQEEKLGLIAKFMGWELEPPPFDEPYPVLWIARKKGHNFRMPSEFEYETDWNQLMKVVKRFNKSEFDAWLDHGDLIAALGAASIKDTFHLIIKGIKWYNQNKEDDKSREK